MDCWVLYMLCWIPTLSNVLSSGTCCQIRMHAIPKPKIVDRWTEKRSMFGVYDNIGILGNYGLTLSLFGLLNDCLHRLPEYGINLQLIFSVEFYFKMLKWDSESAYSTWTLCLLLHPHFSWFPLVFNHTCRLDLAFSPLFVFVGDFRVHPKDLIVAPVWLKGFKGNELQRLIRKKRMVGDKMFVEDRHNLEKRIKFLYRRFNRVGKHR